MGVTELEGLGPKISKDKECYLKLDGTMGKEHTLFLNYVINCQIYFQLKWLVGGHTFRLSGAILQTISL